MIFGFVGLVLGCVVVLLGVLSALTPTQRSK